MNSSQNGYVKCRERGLGLALAFFCVFLSSVFGVMSGLAFGSEEIPPGFEVREFENFREDLIELSGTTALNGPASCKTAYEKIYKREGTLEIRVFLGYLIEETDAGLKATDWVIDPYIGWSLKDMLIRPCEGSLAACGFTQDPENKNSLEKIVTGPDGKLKRAHVVIEVSAASASDHRNRFELRKEQHRLSQAVAHDFLESLSGAADVVIYNGHARYGSGPGFKPLPPGSLAWADAGLFKPSLHQTLRSLRQSHDAPALLGYFACHVAEYYEGKIERVAPETALALATQEDHLGSLPRLPTMTDNASSVLGTLNAVLGMRCEEDFQKSLVLGDVRGLF